MNIEFAALIYGARLFPYVKLSSVTRQKARLCVNLIDNNQQ